MPSDAFNPSGHNYGQRSTTTHHSPPQSNDEVLQWLDALSAQERGLDPRIYSDGRMPQMPQPYYAGGYPSGGYSPSSMPPGPYPSPSYFPNATYQSATTQQLPAGSYPPAYPAGTYALAPQQGSSMQPYVSHQQQFPHAVPHQYPQQQHPQQHQPPYSPSFDPAFAEEFDDYSATESEGTVEAGGSRARSRIPLDASQPLTVEGRMRERVNVACDRCRVRKLRCDGAKPECYNCQRVEGVQCHYDPNPKRRGQDKAQRTRSAVGHRKPRRPAVRKGSKDSGDATSPGASGSGAY